MVGVNNRNLGSFVTDVENSFRIARQLREATQMCIRDSSGTLPDVQKQEAISLINKWLQE